MNQRILQHVIAAGVVALIYGRSIVGLPAVAAEPSPSLAGVIAQVHPKLVKIYGAGGVRGLEAYQSGFLISANGHILTAWSYVLDTDTDGVTVILNDGSRFEAKFVGADPRLEIAVLKIEAEGLDHFNVNETNHAEPGTRVLAFSNLFNVATGDEPVSVLRGIISAKTPLEARRGAFQTTYTGPVYVVDAVSNNPGAAGGALTDRRGRLLGILGKELRNSLNNTWLNYAVPMSELNAAIDDILAGRVRPRSATTDAAAKKPKEPVTLAMLGIRLITDVLPKTPPYIDRVNSGTPAAKAGLRPDDLVLFVNERAVASCKILRDELEFIDRIDEVRLIVQRGQELVEVTLSVEE